MTNSKALGLIALALLGVRSFGITFSNVIATPPTVTVTTTTDMICFTPDSWKVSGSGAFNANVQYDATSAAPMTGVTAQFGGISALNSGSIFFTESFYELDSNGNEIVPLTSLLDFYITLNSSTGATFSQSGAFSKPVTRVRAKKTFTFSSRDSDSSIALGSFWQTYTVPEPTSVLVFGFALVSLAGLRRRS